MSGNPALEAVLTAYRECGDARLLGSAFDLAADDSDRRKVVDVALSAAGLGDDVREKMAQASLDMGDMKAAAELCGDRPELLAIQTEAMIGMGRLAEAEARYLKLVAENPLLESPDIARLLDEAKESASPELGSNVIGFASAARGLRSGARQADDEAKAARAMFGESGQTLRFDDVGGLDEVKKQITRRIVTPFKKPSLFAKYRRKAGGGVLLFGPPGCGKTLLARATAGECEARFVNVPVVDVVDKYLGEAERKLAAIFADARRDTPTVLFFDELEALAGSRSGIAHQSQISLVSTFLAEMDGFARQ